MRICAVFCGSRQLLLISRLGKIVLLKCNNCFGEYNRESTMREVASYDKNHGSTKNGTECIIWLKTSTKRHCLTKMLFLPRGNDSLCNENQENGTFLAKGNHGGGKLVPVRVLCIRFYI